MEQYLRNQIMNQEVNNKLSIYLLILERIERFYVFQKKPKITAEKGNDSRIA